MRGFQPGLIVVFALLMAGLARAQSVPLTVNPASREEVRLFYKGVYSASDNVAMGWTGNHATGVAGDTSPAYKEAVRLRVNFFRALVGLSGNITFNPTFDAKCQQAALMMSANRALSHTPPASWTFYTTAGAEAASQSNLFLERHGPVSITGYIADHGAGNEGLKHRRWIFYPQTTQMGTGDVPGTATVQAANALWILDPSPAGRFGAARPTNTRTLQTMYPTEGYMPYQLVWPRWSFSYPQASFANATITMTRGGQAVAVGEIYRGDNDSTGEPTICWVYDNQDSREPTPHPRPTTDTTYTVTVANVLIGGVARSFTYNVTVFDPEVPSAGAAGLAISGPASPTVGEAAAYTLAKPATAAGLDWRTITTSAYAKTYTAESGLGDLRTTVNAGYSVVQSAQKAAGNSAYFLAHPNPRADQIIQLPDTLYVTGASASVAFSSRLGLATSEQVARVQLSLDDGVSWQDAYAQVGTSATTGGVPTDAAFTRRTVSLAAYVGRTLLVRFNYTAGGGLAFPQDDPTVGAGWYIDDIAVTGVDAVAAAAHTRVASGGTFNFTPAVAGLTLLQGRGVLFGAYPLEWGPVASVTPRAAPGSVSNAGRIINLSILTSVQGQPDSMDMGYVVGGAGTSGGKPLVIRAAGPSLSFFGLGNLLADPKLDLVLGGVDAPGNDNWGGGAALRDALAAVGAFAFTAPDSRDAAVAVNVTTRNNSVKVSSTGTGGGNVLAEIYDATPSDQFTAATPRLINVSVLKPIGEGLTAGFVIGGSSGVRVLVRAVGPKLASFGLTGTVPDPQLVLKGAGGVQLASNDNWSGAELEAAANAVGAFSLDPGAKDAAIVITLQPGNYSAEVKGAGGVSGTALVEVYEVP